MTARIFVDTNVLVYAYDRSEPVKQQQAFNLLHHLTMTGTGVISVQVMAEFFNIITRKITAPLSLDEAYQRLENYQQSWIILDLTPFTVLEAVRGVQMYQLNFCDAHIWAAARMNQITVIFSEDFNNGATLEGVHFINPFAPNFQMADWFTLS